jgi:hypothetical protein
MLIYLNILCIQNQFMLIYKKKIKYIIYIKIIFNNKKMYLDIKIKFYF